MLRSGERIAIIGSRPELKANRPKPADWRERGMRDAQRVDAIIAFVGTIPDGTIVVHGDAEGADTWADIAARRCGLQRVRFPAAWKRRDGQTDMGAGPRRNALIAEYADRCVAFYGAGKSDGTDGCVAMFRKLGKPVECRDWRGEIIER